MNQMKIELNIALIPEEKLAQRLVALSRQLAARYPTLVQLGTLGSRLTLTPHLTLLQAPLFVDTLSDASKLLEEIASKTSFVPTTASRYQYNAGEASFEVQKQVTDQLLVMQEQVVSALNPLRGGLLLERDPAGNVVSEMLKQNNETGASIRTTGYGEYGDPKQGGTFRPHDTTNWFERGTMVDTSANDLPPLSDFDGAYVALGLFVLGPHGTCPQLLMRYELGA